jgi:hypothetical protein
MGGNLGVIAGAFLPLVFVLTFSSFIADMTFRRAALILAAILPVVVWYSIHSSSWYERHLWRERALPPPADEAAFIADPSLRSRSVACAADPHPRDWTGVVDGIYLSTTEDAAMLSVRIAPYIVIHTPSEFTVTNATLVAAAGRPPVALTGIAPGDHVRFAADLLRDAQNCLRTTGGTDDKADRDLGFVATFKRIELISDPGAS